jgi:glutathione synthetase
MVPDARLFMAVQESMFATEKNSSVTRNARPRGMPSNVFPLSPVPKKKSSQGKPPIRIEVEVPLQSIATSSPLSSNFHHPELGIVIQSLYKSALSDHQHSGRRQCHPILEQKLSCFSQSRASELTTSTMASQLTYTNYPPPLTRLQASFLITTIQDKAAEIGCLTKVNDKTTGHPTVFTQPAPITLFPSLFPKTCFDSAQLLQSGFNKLYASIACNVPWLERTLSKIAEIDDFVLQLWKVHYEIVKAGGYKHQFSLGLFRSDYMVHFDKESGVPSLKQVEFNTIASSFGGLSVKVAEIHKHLEHQGVFPKKDMPQVWSPENKAVTILANGLLAGHEAYAKHRPKATSETDSAHRKLCIIFVVQKDESNRFDQRHLENAVWNKGVHVYRVEFPDVLEDLSIDTDGSGRLLYKPKRFAESGEDAYEVSVVYYRAGYSPAEYDTIPTAWSARLMIESSAAIKCPTVLTQLAGTKKVQQVLQSPDSDNPLPGFNSSTTNPDFAKLHTTFVAMHALPATSPLINQLKDPNFARSFVLKPQREGGGNNIYREAISDFVTKAKPEDLVQYILMEMIEPPAQRNTILRAGEVREGNVICELGVYGASLWEVDARGGRGDAAGEVFEAGEEPGQVNGVTMVYNSGGNGYLLRTKMSDVSEGGVAAGFGALDSCCLVDDLAIR